ncbi:hypothetical protein [Brassicibacter mesophilus]|uniref:hypothetical protein n=1 Tax=Brassicibacter mesophilus TaxID=745119 RepID=UPI003D1B61F9
MLLSHYNIKNILCVLITGIVIKTMDDYIDTNKSELINKIVKQHVGSGIISYILLFFSLSCLLNKELSISLFLGAYMVGMFTDLRRPLFFKLNGFYESVIIFTIGAYFLGILMMLLSIIIMTFIQFFDDVIDREEDRYSGNKNFAIKYGTVEISLLAICLLLLSIKLSPSISTMSLVTFVVLQAVEKRIKRGKRNA